MTGDAPRPDLDEAERIWREWTPSTPKSVRPLLAELTRLRAALAERDAEIARLRRDLAGSEHTATVLASVIRALRRTLPPGCAMILESVLNDRGIEVGE